MKTCVKCSRPVFSGQVCILHYKRKPIKRVKKKISYGRKEISDYSKSQVKKDLDVIFMAWTRMRTANEDGMVTCISSLRPYHWSKVDAGHFLPRSTAPGLIFHPDNVWPQSKIDNWFEGNRIEYRKNLIKKIGLLKVEWMEAMQGRKSGIGLFEMKVMLLDYIEKFKLECVRLNHAPNARQQVVLNRWGKEKARQRDEAGR